MKRNAKNLHDALTHAMLRFGKATKKCTRNQKKMKAENGGVDREQNGLNGDTNEAPLSIFVHNCKM